MTSLGSRFLSLYFSGICSRPEGIAFVYISNDGIPSGFVVGASNPRGFYSRLLRRNWFRFFLASVNAMIRHPRVIKRIGRAIFHPSRNPIGDDTAGLFSIAVLPGLQRTGIGKDLVQRFLEEAAQRGCKRVFLTTDRDKNDTVNAFYEKLGFKVDRRYITHEGRRMNEYWKEISCSRVTHDE